MIKKIITSTQRWFDMAEGAAALAVAGTITQVIATEKRAKAQERAAKDQATAKRLAAEEVLERFKFNAEALRTDAFSFQQEQIAAAAKAGLSEQSTLIAMEGTQARLDRQLDIERREAEFKAAQLRAGADIDLRLAGDIKKAKRFEQAGTFLQGARPFVK